MSEPVLGGLRDRLQAQSSVPQLPRGWFCDSAMLAAHGYSYGGDFLVARRVGDRLDMVLVDVCGKGENALPDAVQFAGALRALIGVVPPEELMPAANAYLLGLPNDEAMATAVQVGVDLVTGDYLIRSAGHPPVLCWRDAEGRCHLDHARGTALGVIARPELHVGTGRLGPRDALVFYTDGVVESSTTDLADGIDWLSDRVAVEVPGGYPGCAGRIVADVPRGDDDRAVLVLGRRE